MTQQRGDQAQTVGLGLQSILKTQRKHNAGLIVCAQARVEQDPWLQKKGHKTRAQVPLAVKHHCEYFVYVEKNATKDGKKDELGREFTDDSRKDMTDSAEQTGHKIRVWMEDSSMGPKNRTGEFTLSYEHGVVNVHEEVWRMGCKWGVIQYKAPASYTFGEHKWIGKPNGLVALMKDPNLQGAITAELMKLDKSRLIKDRTEQDVAKDFAPDGSEE